MASSVMLHISVFAGVCIGFLLARTRSCTLPFVHADMCRKRSSCATVLGRRLVQHLGHYQKRTVLT
jgi:hypothetical protein